MSRLRRIGDTLLTLIGFAPFRPGQSQPDPTSVQKASLAAQRYKSAKPHTEIESDVIYARRAMLNGSSDLMRAAKVRKQYAEALRDREEARDRRE